ncbi:MAG: hypothetical protein ACYC3S_12865 [Chloroflexota bacterium]
MARVAKFRTLGPAPAAVADETWLARLASTERVAGVAGPGRWLMARFQSTALFSLKTSMATSTVGKALVVPTPYAIKMALVDAAFRSGYEETSIAEFVLALSKADVRISPPPRATVTHTFVKVRQEPKRPDCLRPYTASIAYREFVHCAGPWRWAFDLTCGDTGLADQLVFLLPRVNYIGKRGSFVQFVGLQRATELTSEFTVPMPPLGTWRMPGRWHVAVLDDFGPEAELSVISSFSEAKVARDKHRKFVHTMVPLGLVSTGPGFSQYET